LAIIIGMVDQLFRDEFARQLRDALGKKDIKPAAAAHKVGIDRQLVYNYLSAAATPAADTLLKLCILLDMEVEYRGVKFSTTAFRQNGKGPQAVVVQQSLFDEPQVLRNGLVEVKIGARRSKDIELTLEMRSAS
jgi:transcriptional regulator with XRE-family HTH domain